MTAAGVMRAVSTRESDQLDSRRGGGVEKTEGAVTDAAITVDEFARRLLDQYQDDAIDVALAIVRRVNLRIQLGMLAAEARARPRSNPLSQAVVLRMVSEYFDVSVDELRGDAVNRRTTRARHHAWAFLRAKTSLSLHEIGKLFHRHHTSVMAGCERVDREGEAWRELNGRLDAMLIEVPQ
jgi:chromosomal replication initiation ATPase DnaA